MSKLPKGFAAIPKDLQREIASKGGQAAQASGKAHKWTPEKAREAGLKSAEARRQRK